MPTLADKIAAREFVVTTELTPPKGTDLSDLFARAQLLEPHVDAFNLTESPRARMAIAPAAVARLLLERGIEPIVQVTARDRNRIAIQSDVLGAAALGVRNFVFMAGDPPANGDHPEAKPVFDLNSNQMLRAAHALAQGRDMVGNPLRGTPSLFLGATANPGASDLAAEVTNTRRKIDAGAHFLQTQAIYERASLERFLEQVRPDGVAILAGIIPLKSAKMAAWLNANLPGVQVPERLLQEMHSVAGSAGEVGRGIEIAARTIQQIRTLCAGVHLMPLGWDAHVPAILASSGVQS
ncbi:MAG TPA: methylenetetrahydrofolate reductase [Steroidobacteraceae bacterium]